MHAADDFVYPERQESPEPPQAIPPSRRATVEEVEDEGDPENFGRFVEPFENEEEGRAPAGTPLETGKTLFERMYADQNAKNGTDFGPFRDEEEWDLARWLMKNVNQTGTDEYLKLPIPQNKKANLSFHNNRAFLKKVDQLPTGPDWTCKIVTAAGNRVNEDDELMSEDLELWMRDPVECIKELLSNPVFREHMAYAPERVYGTKEGHGKSRIVDEMWTAEWWWKLQVQSHRQSRNFGRDELQFKTQSVELATVGPEIRGDSPSFVKHFMCIESQRKMFVSNLSEILMKVKVSVYREVKLK
ncbi:hypothetical protein B0H16DRAFT_1346536 [Mycena metata]|uniref:Uncharacterized protein n=1 Tax=Mycena metata TaxID=1033252 RepID=A0AAD7M834_9AGAR|nr:hypothetical protein B0H16DRAFT_1346536 [Mycena metata]